ncbi:hypothetical protein TSAR_016283 [Trichomalopsis sarcophagae]|uniref:Uncharacterized protein n=1 Tax=Trichomalopsis sarcophagae TaxID=543379 RepID=A0A232FCD6_9HYME|nr:hypothetical protein TSAR_016283 [Trichomalopsis sarcophagae]
MVRVRESAFILFLDSSEASSEGTKSLSRGNGKWNQALAAISPHSSQPRAAVHVNPPSALLYSQSSSMAFPLASLNSEIPSSHAPRARLNIEKAEWLLLFQVQFQFKPRIQSARAAGSAQNNLFFLGPHYNTQQPTSQL